MFWLHFKTIRIALASTCSNLENVVKSRWPTSSFAVFIAVVVTSMATSHAAQISFDDQVLSNAVATITFDELRLGSTDPQYVFEAIPDVGDLMVSFGSLFLGQELGTSQNSLRARRPDAPLTLDPDGPAVATHFDFTSPASPVLGGADNGTFFTTPLAIHFDKPINAVSLEVGSLDGPDSAFVEVFDSQGNSLGTTRNKKGDFETISARASTAKIGGVSVYVAEPDVDWEGFGLNNVAVAVVPEPSHTICCLLLAMTCAARRRRLSR